MNASLSWLVSEEYDADASRVRTREGNKAAATNLVPGVLKLLGQRVVPGRDSGVDSDWLFSINRYPVTAGFLWYTIASDKDPPLTKKPEDSGYDINSPIRSSFTG